jgi:hypothetical protein
MSDEEFYQNLKILMDKLEAHYGTIPIIYTTGKFHDDYLKEVPIQRLFGPIHFSRTTRLRQGLDVLAVFLLRKGVKNW